MHRETTSTGRIERPMNPLHVQIPPRRAGMAFHGYEVRFDESLVTASEDWSLVRSPGRARRRRKQGHPQRILRKETPRRDVFTYEGRGLMPTLVMHPEMWAETVLHIAAEFDFRARAERAGVSVARALQVRKVWNRDGDSVRDILWRTGEVKLQVQEAINYKAAILLAAFVDGPLPPKTECEIVRLHVMSDGVACLLWNNLVIEEGVRP